MFNAYFRRVLFAILLCAIVLPAWADGTLLFGAGDEEATPAPGEIRPFPQLVSVVLEAAGKSGVEQLDGCISDDGLKPGDYASLMRAVPINAGAAHRLWFIRGAQDHLCEFFFGADNFHYLLIDEQLSMSPPGYRLLFRNSSSFFDVYARQSHGLNDIESGFCIAGGCESARLSFDGRIYRPVLCTSGTFNHNAQEVTKPQPCTPDNWGVSGASGLIDLSGH